MTECEVIVMVSADAEWAAVRNLYPNATYSLSPFGEWFRHEATVNGKSIPVVFFQGGWGKISAAASTQHIIDQWHPALIINLGTCGGLKGHIEKGMFVVATDTVVYDIVEQMLDPTEAIDFYSTQLDLTWMQQPVVDPEFRGRTFGIIGLGNIGIRVAEYARLLCAEVLVHTRTPSQERAESLGVTFVDLGSLLERSDIISINTELTPETTGMIGPEEFALMERQPILINTARGKIVVQAALVDALRGGRIRAAGLDVLHDEPPDLSDPLLKMENVLFTPHCSSATVQGFEAQSELCVRNVEAFLEGRPQNVVTP